MKTIFFVIVLLFLSILSKSQTIDNDKAHRHYWYYRTRMINNFMKIGKDQGDCVVFAKRNANEINFLSEP